MKEAGPPQRIEIGNFEVWIIQEGGFSLDGGAMFGMVPKVMWSRLQDADENNLITIGTNSLLVKTPDAEILIDPGIGSGLDSKRKEIFRVSSPRNLLQGLEEAGSRPGEITGVILSHLHFDHAGGLATREGESVFSFTFPNAKHFVQRVELDDALEPNELSKGSYITYYIDLLVDGRKVEVLDGDCELFPGIRVEKVGGHTRGLQIIFIESKGKKGVFWSDLIPTTDHLRIPYVAGVDLYPLEVVSAKKAKLLRACEEGWLSFFYHNTVRLWGTIERGKRDYAFCPGRLVPHDICL